MSGLTCLANLCARNINEARSAKEHRHRFIATEEHANGFQIEYPPGEEGFSCFAALRGQLRTHGGHRVRKVKASRRRPRLSTKGHASRVLRGSYMGYMGHLNRRQKAQVRKVKEAKGFRAAIAKARKFAQV